MGNKIKLLVILAFLGGVHSQEINGEVTSWGTITTDDSRTSSMIGCRFIPELEIDNLPLLHNSGVYLAANLYGYSMDNWNGERSEFNLKLHRLWYRFHGDQSELRLGMQKINFGPAKLLRSLQWFDTIDPQDPTGFTDGIWGVRYRYSTLSNTSILGWILYANDGVHGIDHLPTKHNSPEFGGRILLPLLSGELGVSTHHRNVSIDDENNDITENRLGLDGIWDIGIGIWFETVLIHTDLDNYYSKWQSITTIGGDYTFPIDNGIGMTLEYMRRSSGKEFAMNSFTSDLSEMLVYYPFGLLDQFQIFSINIWDEGMHLYYLAWQRTWDQIIVRSSIQTE